MQEIYKELVGNIPLVYSCFQHFFGEERVDLQNVLSYEEFKELMLSYTVSELLDKYSTVSSLDIVTNRDSPIDEEIFKKLYPCLNKIHVLKEDSNATILVWYPDVTITNEYNKSHEIKDLYIQVRITTDGTLLEWFKMNRGTYSEIELHKGYLHSHCTGLPAKGFTYIFQKCCMGSGPIVSTLSLLATKFDEDKWLLFCYELDKYIHTESVEGTPYYYIENLYTAGKNITKYNPADINKISYEDSTLLSGFLDYFLSKDIPYYYNNGSFQIGLTFKEFHLLVSKHFIDYVNKNKIDDYYQYIYEAYVTEDGFAMPSSSTSVIKREDYEGEVICTFKGEDIRIKVYSVENNTDVKYSLLSFKIAGSLYYKIINLLNLYYGDIQRITKTKQIF